MKKVLVGSPVHQQPEVLKHFLSSLHRLSDHGAEISFLFIDDNSNEESKDLLQQFSEQTARVEILPSNFKDIYQKDGYTHYWNENLVWKVAGFKNHFIRQAIDQGFDYLFLIDSDLVLYPETIPHLMNQNCEIISEIYWTRWQPNSIEQPQVWVWDEYQQYEKELGEKLSDEESNVRFHSFLNKMRVPGVYEVGGLGACTLISREALKKGVSFSKIKNISFWGEDRHFCVRAAALGIPMHVDTHYPAYHIYRETDLEGAGAFFQKTALQNGEKPAIVFKPYEKKPKKLTLSMVVRNESGRFLEKVLTEHKKYIDEAVIIDDGSTDDTGEICLRVLDKIPVRLIRNEQSKFSNEVELRKQQWEETIKTDPDWILNLDADEVFEDKFPEEVKALMDQDLYDLYSFRIYDFWTEDSYREDEYWRAHFYYRPFLARYKKDFLYTWQDVPQHCGRFPNNMFQLPNAISQLRLKHLGWSRPEFRLEKFKRYQELDPGSQYGIDAQYLSILDENPNLVKWIE